MIIDEGLVLGHGGCRTLNILLVREAGGLNQHLTALAEEADFALRRCLEPIFYK